MNKLITKYVENWKAKEKWWHGCDHEMTETIDERLGLGRKDWKSLWKGFYWTVEGMHTTKLKTRSNNACIYIDLNKHKYKHKYIYEYTSLYMCVLVS